MAQPDPRGPLVSVTEVLPGQCDGNYYVLMCGHSTVSAPHFAMNKVGELMRCFDCGREDLERWMSQCE